MINLTKRSVFDFHTSFLISLPRKFCKRNKLKKGMKINVYEFGNRVIVIPSNEVDNLGGLIRNLNEIRRSMKSQEVKG